jgi:hypothetical protein
MRPITPMSRNSTAAPRPSIRTSRSRRSIAPSSCSRIAGIIEKHEFRDGRARYEPIPDEHHDHLIDVKSGDVIEFRNARIEALQEEIARELGYRIVDHRLELYAVPIDDKDKN